MSFDGLLLSGQPTFGSLYTAFIVLNKPPQDFFVIASVIK